MQSLSAPSADGRTRDGADVLEQQPRQHVNAGTVVTHGRNILVLLSIRVRGTGDTKCDTLSAKYVLCGRTDTGRG